MNGLTAFSPSTSTLATTIINQTENEQNKKEILNSPSIDFNQFIIYWDR